jgi:predicted deacylase
LRRVGRSQLHRQLRAAEAQGYLASGSDEAKTAAAAMRERLEQLGIVAEETALLADDRLAAGSRVPFLPLVQLVELGDFIEAGARP